MNNRSNERSYTTGIFSTMLSFMGKAGSQILKGLTLLLYMQTALGREAYHSANEEMCSTLSVMKKIKADEMNNLLSMELSNESIDSFDGAFNIYSNVENCQEGTGINVVIPQLHKNMEHHQKINDFVGFFSTKNFLVEGFTQEKLNCNSICVDKKTGMHNLFLLPKQDCEFSYDKIPARINCKGWDVTELREKADKLNIEVEKERRLFNDVMRPLHQSYLDAHKKLLESINQGKGILNSLNNLYKQIKDFYEKFLMTNQKMKQLIQNIKKELEHLNDIPNLSVDHTLRLPPLVSEASQIITATVNEQYAKANKLLDDFDYLTLKERNEQGLFPALNNAQQNIKADDKCSIILSTVGADHLGTLIEKDKDISKHGENGKQYFKAHPTVILEPKESSKIKSKK